MSAAGHWRFLALSVVGWALFSIYWDAAAKKVNAVKSSESGGSRRIHVFLVNIALLSRAGDGNFSGYLGAAETGAARSRSTLNIN